VIIEKNMKKHKVYSAIVKAVRTGKLKEPFTNNDFRKACPGFADGTYNVFLNKHRIGNPGGNSELFKRISPGIFELVRPVKYGI